MNIARRIAAMLLLEPALDANCAAVKQAIYAWHAQRNPKGECGDVAAQ